MEFVGNLILFLISSALIVVAWFGFAFVNNIVDSKIRNVLVREIAGGAAAVALFAVVSLIVYWDAISFFSGLMLFVAILVVIHLVRKGWFAVKPLSRT